MRNSILEDAQVINDAVHFKSLDGATILITGATGLLGTHFLSSLLVAKERGIKMQVYGLCHSNPADYTIEIARRGDFILQPCFPTKADVIIHAAGYAQPTVFLQNPAETFRLNTELTQQLLGNLEPNGRFLFISSSEVYSGLSGVVDELEIGTTNPYHSRSCYIEGKRGGEAICNAYYSTGVKAKAARLSLAYGPGTRKDDKRALSVFIEQALKTGKITMNYSGQDLRTFCYIRDAIEMLWQICLRGKEQVYNVGSPIVYSVFEVAKTVAKITGAELVTPEGSEELLGSSQGTIMSLHRFEREFEKLPFVPLLEGLKNTIDWQRGLYAL